MSAKPTESMSDYPFCMMAATMKLLEMQEEKVTTNNTNLRECCFIRGN
jgi:hypothetical protein